MLIRIVAPYFVAGIVLEEGVVIEAAPIVRYMMGWSGMRVRSYAKRKHWTAMPCPGSELLPD